jgi:hypothetical protein
VAGDPADPEALARFAAAGEEPQPTLRAPGLHVRPSLDARRTKLRAVQCASTDPVSFALAEGCGDTAFPELAGWSAADWAGRAVAEHRFWLDGMTPAYANGYEWIDAPPAPDVNGVVTRNRLLAAARAALFQESLEDGDPTLLLSADAVADRLGVEGDDVRAVRRAVFELRAYR